MKIGDIVYPIPEAITRKINPLSPHKYQVIKEIVPNDMYLLKDLETQWMESGYSDEFTSLPSNKNNDPNNNWVVEKIMVDLISSIENLCGGKLDQRKALPILSIIEEQVELIINNSRQG